MVKLLRVSVIVLSQIAVLTVALVISFFMFSDCNEHNIGTLECNYPPSSWWHSFYLLWVSVPCLGLFIGRRLGGSMMKSAMVILAVLWMLLSYTIWAGVPGAPMGTPLLLGSSLASLVVVFIGLQRESVV